MTDKTENEKDQESIDRATKEALEKVKDHWEKRGR